MHSMTMFLLSETGEKSDCLFCFGVDFFKYHIRTYRVIKFFPCTSYGQIPRNFTNHSSLPTVQWLRMIDNVGYPVRCLVLSLNNHKLLQFLQHSITPLFVIFHFPITSNSMKHSRLSKRRSQTSDNDWQQSLLNVVAMVSFQYESYSRVIAITST